jgi:hypothetical protein
MDVLLLCILKIRQFLMNFCLNIQNIVIKLEKMCIGE